MFIELPSEHRHSTPVNGHRINGQLPPFEQTLNELSTRFGDLPAGECDQAMREALQTIGETLELDRGMCYRIQPDGLWAEVVAWTAPGTPAGPTPAPVRDLFPWACDMALAGSVACFSSVDEIPNPVDRESHRLCGTRSSVIVPLVVAGQTVGAVGFHTIRREHRWSQDDLHRLRVMASTLGGVLNRGEHEATLRRMLTDVERLRDQLQAQNIYLRRETQERLGSGIIVGQSPAVLQVLDQVRQVAATDSTVLLLGETGTGKELFATQIHELSARRARAMVRVNCSAIPATLMESELYGREKGAFTGALARQIGRFELADHSTIFLDEIGELPQDVQVKLLRVLEERQIERLGSPKAIRVNTRIIAATHRDLEQRIAEGTFREDLFYRLNVFPIHVPSLRERVEDIPLLVWRFVEEFSRAFGKRIDTISRDNMAALQQYSWPGNIRELRNVVERAMIVATGSCLSLTLPTPSAAATKRSLKLVDVEKEHIRGVLESTRWRVRGTGGAAEKLGLPPTTLETRLVKLGLKRPKPS